MKMDSILLIISRVFVVLPAVMLAIITLSGFIVDLCDRHETVGTLLICGSIGLIGWWMPTLCAGLWRRLIAVSS